MASERDGCPPSAPSPRADESSTAALLIDAYGEVMPGIGHTQRNHDHETEDVVHDLCVRILESTSPTPIQNPVRYWFRAIRNLTIDRHRARNRASVLFESIEPAEQTAATLLDPERVVSGQQRLEIIAAAIERLPPRCKEAFERHRFAGMSYVEVARQMKISPSMVEKHMSDAMLRLSEALERADATDGRPGGP